ncbi:GAF domain-containing protein [Nannocystis pusilla]|uniref:GAF domain-containing protein n=1 Tax=Nannocystis pusilla TaxID=889268 RepID=UPI003B76337E
MFSIGGAAWSRKLRPVGPERLAHWSGTALTVSARRANASMPRNPPNAGVGGRGCVDAAVLQGGSEGDDKRPKHRRGPGRTRQSTSRGASRLRCPLLSAPYTCMFVRCTSEEGAAAVSALPAVILSVLALSILLQVAAAVLALRLIRRTTAAGHAWLLLAFAMLLMASRRVVTILGLYFPALEQTFRGVIAETIGLAVAGLVFAGVLQMPRVFDALAAARNASEAGRRRAAFLVEASAALVAAPQEAAVRVALLAKLPVPAFADAVLVDVFDDRGVVRRIAAAAAPGVAEFLCRHHPPNVDAPGELGAVLRGGEPVLAEEAPADALTRIAPGAVSPELSIRSYVIVPLAARDRRFGALILVSLRERHYSHEDQALAADLARVAALTLDNARLYSEAQEAIHVRDRFLSIASHELRTPLTPSCCSSRAS